VPATNTIRIPRLPTAARKAGATSIRRTSGNVFSIGYAFVGDDHRAPGNGPTVCEALQDTFGPHATVTWDGAQSSAIVLTFV
jgi:hypothetical protein